MSETYSMTLGSTRQRRKGMQSSGQAFKYKTGWLVVQGAKGCFSKMNEYENH